MLKKAFLAGAVLAAGFLVWPGLAVAQDTGPSPSEPAVVETESHDEEEIDTSAVETIAVPDNSVEASDEELLSMSIEDLLSLEVESASKHTQSILWSPSSISVYTKQEILASGALSLAEFLRRVPGLSVAQFDDLWHQVGARGVSDRANGRVMLLVNGVEHVMELSGFPLWMGSPYSLEEVERIEIIKGPGSALYGANAFSAVINVVTLSEWEDGGELVAQAGERRFWSGFASVRGAQRLGKGVLRYRLSLDYARSGEGLTDPEQSQQFEHLQGVVRYQTGIWDLAVHAGGVYAPEYFIDTVLGELDCSAGHEAFVSARAAARPSDDLELSVAVYQFQIASDARFRNRVNGLGTWLAEIPLFRVKTDTTDVQAQANWQLTPWLMAVGGGSFRYLATTGTNTLPERASELRGGGFLQLGLAPLDWLQFTGGVRADGNSDTDFALSPRAAVVVKPGENHAIRLSYGLAFRKPSYMESSLHFAVDEDHVSPALAALGEGIGQDRVAGLVGNPNIKNERVQSLELGYRTLQLDNQLQLTLDLFYNRFLDLIFFAFPEDGDLIAALMDEDSADLKFQNSKDVIHALGGEAEVRWMSKRGFHLFGNVSPAVLYRDAEDKRLVTSPLIRANAGGGLAPAFGVHFDLATHYVSTYTDNGLISPEDFAKTVEMRLGNTWMLVGRLGYRVRLDESGKLLDASLLGKLPLGPGSAREVAGFPADPSRLADLGTTADYGGEPQARWLGIGLQFKY